MPRPKTEQGGNERSETPLERAYRLGQGIGGLDAAGVKRLVEMSRENEKKKPQPSATTREP